MTEEWRDIPGEPDYQVSSLGRVRALHILKLVASGGTGYLTVNLKTTGTKHIHSLVSLAFLGSRPAGMEVNHIDGKRTNNIPSNLEYVTREGNVHHAFKIGNRKHYFTEKQTDKIADAYFTDGLSVCGIARTLLPKKYTVQQERGMRKKVRSVVGIWRASQRPKEFRAKYERKLYGDAVDKIRKLYATGEYTQAQIAGLFRCHPAHVSRVVNRLLHKGNPVASGKYVTRTPNHPEQVS